MLILILKCDAVVFHETCVGGGLQGLKPESFLRVGANDYVSLHEEHLEQLHVGTVERF